MIRVLYYYYYYHFFWRRKRPTVFGGRIFFLGIQKSLWKTRPLKAVAIRQTNSCCVETMVCVACINPYESLFAWHILMLNILQIIFRDLIIRVTCCHEAHLNLYNKLRCRIRLMGAAFSFFQICKNVRNTGLYWTGRKCSPHILPLIFSYKKM